MIKFEKISLKQWKKDCSVEKILRSSETKVETIEQEDKVAIYYDIKLPQRATKGSAGYDIYSPFYFTLAPKETIKFPLGIRVRMDNNKSGFLGLGQNEDYSSNIVFMIYPRSSLGFKYKFQLDNNVGIIDQDYYNSDNGGHIWAKFTNWGEKRLEIKKGDAICQGIFMKYLTTDDDNVTTTRNGGFGSTNKR